MKKNGIGGANTNIHGLKAEDRILLIINKFFITHDAIIGQKNQIYCYEKIGLIFNKQIIENIKYKPQPDVFIFFPKQKKLWIIEIKNQDTPGTGWEKFEFGLYGYKNDIYQRVFNKLKPNVEGVYCGKWWNKIQYLPDVKEYIKRTYSKKLYCETEINDLIKLISSSL